MVIYITIYIMTLQYNQTTELTQKNDTNSTSSTLRDKLDILEEQIIKIQKEMTVHKKYVMELKNEKERLQETLKSKTGNVKESLIKDIDQIEDQMSKHFAHLTAENGRLQQKVTTLKSEKTALQNELIALQRRISDIEMQVGNDDIKYQ